MQNILTIFHIIVAILLIITILLQHKNSGLSATFGGGGSVQATKRGVDKILEQATVVLVLFFLISSFMWIFI